MTVPEDMSKRVLQLRESFDRSFELPYTRAEGRGGAQYLLIHVGAQRCALAVSALSGLVKLPPVVPLPSSERVLGLTAVRGRLTAVYSLAALLSQPAGESPRWLALLQEEQSAGLAFDALDGLIQVEDAAVHQLRAEAERTFMRKAMKLASEVVVVVDAGGLLADIRRELQPVAG